MLVRWTLHAKHMFAERAAMLGLNYGEIELAIKKQEVKISEGTGKFKTVFAIRDTILTVVKAEKPEFIYVLTLWEASEEEAEKWKKR
ncbi:MAG: hypothetical protein NT067_05240 [Candidatus Diapherotrites archaeon]|nr:hypothetical protein [Candidatus Diapherotrites archaeon]